MDHAFRGVHGFGYDELRNSQTLRAKVEKRRQADHEKVCSLQLSSMLVLSEVNLNRRQKSMQSRLRGFLVNTITVVICILN